MNLGGFGLFVNIVMAVVASLLFLGAVAHEDRGQRLDDPGVRRDAAGGVIWPLLPWVARVAMRAFAVCLIVPVLWAMCFAASAAVGVERAELQGAAAR